MCGKHDITLSSRMISIRGNCCSRNRDRTNSMLWSEISNSTTAENNSFNVQPELQTNIFMVNDSFRYNHESNRSDISIPCTIKTQPKLSITSWPDVSNSTAQENDSFSAQSESQINNLMVNDSFEHNHESNRSNNSTLGTVDNHPKLNIISWPEASNSIAEENNSFSVQPEPQINTLMVNDLFRYESNRSAAIIPCTDVSNSTAQENNSFSAQSESQINNLMVNDSFGHNHESNRSNNSILCTVDNQPKLSIISWPEASNSIAEENNSFSVQPEPQINTLMVNNLFRYESNKSAAIIPCTDVSNSTAQENNSFSAQSESQINNLMVNDSFGHNHESNISITSTLYTVVNQLKLNIISWLEASNSITEENNFFSVQPEPQINTLMINDLFRYESNKSAAIIPCTDIVSNSTTKEDSFTAQPELQITTSRNNDLLEHNYDSERSDTSTLRTADNQSKLSAWSETSYDTAEENNFFSVQSKPQINTLMVNDSFGYNHESSRSDISTPCTNNDSFRYNDEQNRRIESMVSRFTENRNSKRRERERKNKRKGKKNKRKEEKEWIDITAALCTKVDNQPKLNLTSWSEVSYSTAKENSFTTQSELQMDTLKNNDSFGHDHDSNISITSTPYTVDNQSKLSLTSWSEVSYDTVKENTYPPHSFTAQPEVQMDTLKNNDSFGHNHDSNISNIRTPCTEVFNNIAERKPFSAHSEVQMNSLTDNDSFGHNYDPNRSDTSVSYTVNNQPKFSVISWPKVSNSSANENNFFNAHSELQIDTLTNNNSFGHNHDSKRSDTSIPCTVDNQRKLSLTSWPEVPNDTAQERNSLSMQPELQINTLMINNLFGHHECNISAASTPCTIDNQPKLSITSWPGVPNSIAEGNNSFSMQSDLHINTLMAFNLFGYNHESNRSDDSSPYTVDNQSRLSITSWPEVPNSIVREYTNDAVDTQPELSIISWPEVPNGSFRYNDEQKNKRIESMVSRFTENRNSKRREKERKKKIKKNKRKWINKTAVSALHTKNIQSELATEACFNRGKRYNEMQTIYMKNDKFASIVTIPAKILTKDEFMMTWFSWKSRFIAYMKSIDQTESNKQKWGLMLLNRIGPIGQEIQNTFTFNQDHVEEDIDILLKKFDFYYIFKGMRRRDNEEIYEYVNDLRIMASKHVTNTDKIVKEKILMEIDKDKFTRQAKTLIPGFSFPSSIESLTIKEITSIWMSYEKQIK